MARLEFFVVSRALSIDQNTNQLSVFEILEELHSNTFPVIIPACVAVSLFRREELEEHLDFQEQLKISTPAGDEFEIITNFQLKAARHRVLQRIEGLVIKEEGKLQFELILNGKHMAEHIVDVHRSEPIDAISSSVITR